jgi:hypothetical protein
MYEGQTYYYVLPKIFDNENDTVKLTYSFVGRASSFISQINNDLTIKPPKNSVNIYLIAIVLEE